MGISSIDQRPECMSMNESSVSFYNVPSCFGEISIPFSNSSIKYKSIPVQLIKSIPASESFIYHKMLRSFHCAGCLILKCSYAYA